MRITHPIHLLLVLCLATSACVRQDANDAASRNGDATNATAGDASPGAQGAGANTGAADQVAGERGAVVDGRLATDPAFRMPAASAARLPQAGAGLPLDTDSVRLALIDGMQASGEAIQVQVTPRGVVTLSGEVASIADRQRAHYLARALPGAAEVDISRLYVRRR